MQGNYHLCNLFSSTYTGSRKKNPAKFSDTCSVRADGLCNGCPQLVGSSKAGNSNMQELFCSTLYFPTSIMSTARAEATRRVSAVSAARAAWASPALI